MSKIELPLIRTNYASGGVRRLITLIPTKIKRCSRTGRRVRRKATRRISIEPAAQVDQSGRASSRHRVIRTEGASGGIRRLIRLIPTKIKRRSRTRRSGRRNATRHVSIEPAAQVDRRIMSKIDLPLIRRNYASRGTRRHITLIPTKIKRCSRTGRRVRRKATRRISIEPAAQVDRRIMPKIDLPHRRTTGEGGSVRRRITPIPTKGKGCSRAGRRARRKPPWPG